MTKKKQPYGSIASESRNPGLSRRRFLKLGGAGVLASLAAGAGLIRVNAPEKTARAAPAAAALTQLYGRFTATDGYVSYPGRRIGDNAGVYVFGFRNVPTAELNDTPEQLITKYKGKVQHPSPILGVPKDTEFYLTLTNLGLVVRPDLDDSHTVHWHGFRNPNAIFDGVPEVSIAVPVARDFPYFFIPRVEGTYMYHCHFEDAEHVQMGMAGVSYIEAANGNTYDGDGGATAFDREFTFLLNEVDTRPHDNLENVQEFVWSDYKPNYWVINGRSYPDTVIRDQDLGGTDFDQGDYFTQPISSLVQVEEGETALLRFASLGYEQQAMQLLGIAMLVVGHDATYLGANSYMTNSIYIGPGEARDVLIVAPSYNVALPGGTDGAGDYNVYWLRNRANHRLVNGTEPGLGGQVTEVRVYPSTTLGPQLGPNKTI